MDDDVRLGRRFRALRHRLGWRQRDLGEEAEVSQGTVSWIECGRIGEVSSPPSVARRRRWARSFDWSSGSGAASWIN